jgi:hypothetical protein
MLTGHLEARESEDSSPTEDSCLGAGTNPEKPATKAEVPREDGRAEEMLVSRPREPGLWNHMEEGDAPGGTLLPSPRPAIQLPLALARGQSAALTLGVSILLPLGRSMWFFPLGPGRQENVSALFL